MKHLFLALLLLLGGAAEAATPQAKFIGVVPVKPPQLAGNASVAITSNGTGTPASLFQDNGTTPIANPMRSDTYGLFQFTTAVGVYDITITRSDGTISVLTKQTIGVDTTLIPWSTPGIIGSVTPNSAFFTALNATGQITSTLATGTPPLVIASTTLVPNLYVARSALADTVTTNANLTGPITSVGNATSVASQTGTGTTFVMNTSPTLVTPVLGTATATAITSGNLTDSALTSGRVPYATTAGLMTDSAALTFNGTDTFKVGDGTVATTSSVDGGAATIRTMSFKTAGSGRWQFQANATAEAGANAGSDLRIRALTDAGALIDDPITITRASGGSITLSRPLSGTSLTLSTALAVAQGGTGATSASSARTNLGVAVDTINGMIELPSAKTYNLILSSEVAYTVNEVIIQTASGTCTAAVKINGTNITGASAISVSSTPTTATCTAANTISTTQALTLVLSSLSSAVDVSFTVKLTK